MKTASIAIAIFNTLPLGVYAFVVVPIVEILQKGIANEGSFATQFCGYGFLWGALLYPAFLVFNHIFFVRNHIHQAYRAAFINQLYTLAYLGLVAIYGTIAFH